MTDGMLAILIVLIAIVVVGGGSAIFFKHLENREKKNKHAH